MKRALYFVFIFILNIGCKPIEFDDISVLSEKISYPIKSNTIIKDYNRPCKIAYSSSDLMTLYIDKKENQIEENLLFKAAEIFNSINPAINFQPTPYFFESNIYFLTKRLTFGKDPGSIAYNSRIFTESIEPSDYYGLLLRKNLTYTAYIKPAHSEDQLLHSYIFTLGRYLGLQESNNKESWMYPYYTPEVKKKFLQEEVAILKDFQSRCASGDEMNSALNTIKADGSVSFRLDFRIEGEFATQKCGVIISENPEKLNIYESPYFSISFFGGKSRWIAYITVGKLNANTTYYYRGFMYSKNGITLESTIKKLIIPNRSNDKWEQKSFNLEALPDETFKFYFSNHLYSILPTQGNKNVFNLIKRDASSGEIVENKQFPIPSENLSSYIFGKYLFFITYQSSSKMICYRYDMELKTLDSISVPVLNYFSDKGALLIQNSAGIFVSAYQYYPTQGKYIYENLYKLDFDNLKYLKYNFAENFIFNPQYNLWILQVPIDDATTAVYSAKGEILNITFDHTNHIVGSSLYITSNLMFGSNGEEWEVNSNQTILPYKTSTYSTNKIYGIALNSTNDVDGLQKNFKQSAETYNNYFSRGISILNNRDNSEINALRVFDPKTLDENTLSMPPNIIFQNYTWKNNVGFNLIDGGDKLYLVVNESSTPSKIWIYHK